MPGNVTHEKSEELPAGVSKSDNLVSVRWRDIMRPAPPDFRFNEPYLPVFRVVRLFQRALVYVIDTLFGPFTIQKQSQFLTPHWKRLFAYLQIHNLTHRLVFSPPRKDEPFRYNFYLFTHFRQELSDGRAPFVTGLGRGFSADYERAVSTAFGELLERVPFLYYRNSDFIYATPRELRAANMCFVEPSSIDAFTDRQREHHVVWGTPTEDSKIRWVQAHPLDRSQQDSKAPVQYLLPAQLFFWTYKRGKKEPLLFPMSTHGGAGYFSRDEALVRALYEWIQRDGFFGFWLTGSAPSSIRLASITSGEVQKLIQEVKSFGFELHLLDITPHDIPVSSVCCVLTSRTSSIASIVCGSGCHIDLYLAMRDAIEEALSMYHWLSDHKISYVLPSDYHHMKSPINDIERLSWWANQPLSRIAWFLEGDKVDCSALRERYQHAVGVCTPLEVVRNLLSKSEHDVWYVESQHSVLAATGFHSVRVYIKDLVPMYHGGCNVPLALLYRRYGASDRTPEYPHPFP